MPAHWKRRKRSSFSNRLRRLAPLIVVALLLCLGLILEVGTLTTSTVTIDSLIGTTSFPPPVRKGSLYPQKSSVRSVRVYPYSVIPGGVRSVGELREAISRDQVVAAQYATFDLKSARLIRLQHARAVYVSYRIDNRIFWTKRKVKLARGETVITDGKHMARTRCGNLVSTIQRAPILPKEPAPVISDTSEPPYVSVAPDLLPLANFTPPAPEPPSAEPPAPEPPAPEPPSVTNLPSPPSGGGPVFFPPVFFFPDGDFPIYTAKNPAPPVQVPEPGTLALLLVALPSIWIFRRWLGK
jgi:hypothetical protein